MLLQKQVSELELLSIAFNSLSFIFWGQQQKGNFRKSLVKKDIKY